MAELPHRPDKDNLTFIFEHMPLDAVRLERILVAEKLSQLLQKQEIIVQALHDREAPDNHLDGWGEWRFDDMY